MILELEDLRKSFGKGFSLHVESLGIEAGEAVLLQGENGSGKTTLLKLLCGLMRPDACGKFVFNGRPRRRWECDSKVAFLHQSPYLFDMTVRANVEYGLRSRSDPEAPSKALAALERVGMAGFAERGVRELSGGEIQRIALARVWVLEPKLYLLDEPLSHLDSQGMREICGLFARIAEGGATLIVSSHETMAENGIRWRSIGISNGRLLKPKASRSATTAV